MIGDIISDQLDWGNDRKLYETIVATCAIIGVTVGSLVSGEITVYGRRKALIYSNFSVFFAVGLMLIPNLEAICAGRFIQGFAGSLNLCATNMYLGETIPAHKRSKYGIAVNSGIITGLLITTLFGLLLPEQGTPESETT